MNALRTFAATTLVLGTAAAFAGSPYRAGQDHSGGPHVTALELAAWIRDRHPGLRLIDLRTEAEFNAYQIPSAEHIPSEDIGRLPATSGETLVVYARDAEVAAKAASRLRSTGHSQVIVLTGGVNAWIDDVMNPVQSTELTRYFGGTARPAGAIRTVRRGC